MRDHQLESRPRMNPAWLQNRVVEAPATRKELCGTCRILLPDRSVCLAREVGAGNLGDQQCGKKYKGGEEDSLHTCVYTLSEESE